MHPFQYLASKHNGRAKTLQNISKDVSAANSKSLDPIAVANGDADDDDDDGNEDDDDGYNDDCLDGDENHGGGNDVKSRAKRISCHLCDEKLRDKKDYEDHVIAAHGVDGAGSGAQHHGGTLKEEIFFKKCPICSKPCKTPGLMKLHMRDAHSDPFARFVSEENR